jgi:hypothetical protein
LDQQILKVNQNKQGIMKLNENNQIGETKNLELKEEIVSQSNI